MMSTSTENRPPARIAPMIASTVAWRSPDMSVRRPRIALLVPSKADATTAGAADVSRRQREVHERAVGPVIVVAPDQAFFVGEHRPPPFSFLWLGDPGCRLLDPIYGQASYLSGLLQRRPVGGERLVEVLGRGGNELPVRPTLLGDVGRQGVEQCEIRAGVDRQM